MTNRILGNYLKVHRQKAGLSQLELGRLVGYKHRWVVSRHERSRTAPPFLIALAYQEVFRVPVSAIFTGFHATVAQVIDQSVGEFEKELRDESVKGRRAMLIAQKLEWLTKRRNKT